MRRKQQRTALSGYTSVAWQVGTTSQVSSTRGTNCWPAAPHGPSSSLGNGCRLGGVLSAAPGTWSCSLAGMQGDRKSTRLNSSHLVISYAVFCLKKKKKNKATSALGCRLR